MRNVPYSVDSTVPSATASELIDHALQMNKFEVEKDTIGDIIILPREQAVLMTYYRNNITHMLMLPSLMAAIITSTAVFRVRSCCAIFRPSTRW